MAIEKQINNGTCTLKISGEVKIYDVASFKDQIFENFDSYSALNLDLSATEDMDTSGLQLLMLVRKEAQTRNISFRVVASSDPADKLLKLFNLTEWFQASIT